MHLFLVTSALIVVSCYQLKSSDENHEHQMIERNDNNVEGHDEDDFGDDGDMKKEFDNPERNDNNVEELKNNEDDFGDDGDMKKDNPERNDPWGRRRRRWIARRRRRWIARRRRRWFGKRRRRWINTRRRCSRRRRCNIQTFNLLIFCSITLVL